MSEVIVYHGSTESVPTPICQFGRPNLDFGQGFYVTVLRQQAVAWANNIARNRQQTAKLNRYKMDAKPYCRICVARCLVLTMPNGSSLSLATAMARIPHEVTITLKVVLPTTGSSIPSTSIRLVLWISTWHCANFPSTSPTIRCAY